jgi:hypothetical protein
LNSPDAYRIRSLPENAAVPRAPASERLDMTTLRTISRQRRSAVAYCARVQPGMHLP